MPLSAVLLDLEGVLYQEGAPISGAREALGALEGRGLALRYLTNTTTTSRAGVARRLEAVGLTVDPATLFTPLDAVVLGDLYKEYDWDRLNFLFGLIRGGARLVALHKNRVCRRGDEIALDAGPFVAALEYAAGVEAVVVGKPSADFFKLALADLGVAPGEAVMVGDDIEADIGGAQGAGIKAIQVETGKYSPADRDHPRVTPDLRIASVADLPAEAPKFEDHEPQEPDPVAALPIEEPQAVARDLHDPVPLADSPVEETGVIEESGPQEPEPVVEPPVEEPKTEAAPAETPATDADTPDSPGRDIGGIASGWWNKLRGKSDPGVAEPETVVPSSGDEQPSLETVEPAEADDSPGKAKPPKKKTASKPKAKAKSGTRSKSPSKSGGKPKARAKPKAKPKPKK